VRNTILMIFAVGCLLYSQEFRSTLTGRVADPSGAVVPKVRITAIKTDTNSRFETVSGSEGAAAGAAPLVACGAGRIVCAEAPDEARLIAALERALDAPADG